MFLIIMVISIIGYRTDFYNWSISWKIKLIKSHRTAICNWNNFHPFFIIIINTEHLLYSFLKDIKFCSYLGGGGKCSVIYSQEEKNILILAGTSFTTSYFSTFCRFALIQMSVIFSKLFSKRKICVSIYCRFSRPK